MHAGETAGKVTVSAPGVEEVAVQVVLEDLVAAAVRGPKVAVVRDDEHVDVGGPLAHAPLVQVFAVFVEDLDSAVAAVVDEDPVGRRVDGNAVDIVPVVGASLVGRRTPLAPGGQVIAFGVELDHPGAVVAVGDDEAAVGEPGHERRAVEVGLVGAQFAVGADGLHQRGAVIGELVDDVLVVVDDPDVLFGIIGVDGDVVGPLQHGIPLVPGFHDVAVAVEHQDAVLPAGIDAEASTRFDPAGYACFGQAAGSAAAGNADPGGVAPDARGRKAQARTNLRNAPV